MSNKFFEKYIVLPFQLFFINRHQFLFKKDQQVFCIVCVVFPVVFLVDCYEQQVFHRVFCCLFCCFLSDRQQFQLSAQEWATSVLFEQVANANDSQSMIYDWQA